MPATQRVRLWSGRPIWRARRLPQIPYRPIRSDLKCDALIVGAGISGAMVADALSEKGLSVVILDRRDPATGSSAASTALLQYEIDTPLSLLAKRIGRDRSERIWRRSHLALDALRHRALHFDLDVGCDERDSLNLQGNTLDADGLRAEAQARRRAGLETTFLPPALVEERYGIARRAAILNPGNLTADPRRLTAGFLRAAAARGTRIYAPADATDIASDGRGVSVATSQGAVEHVLQQNS